MLYNKTKADSDHIHGCTLCWSPTTLMNYIYSVEGRGSQKAQLCARGFLWNTIKQMLKYKVLAQYHSLGTEFKKKKKREKRAAFLRV